MSLLGAVVAIPALVDNYIWVLLHQNKKNCIIIDPGSSAEVVAYITKQELVVDAILITHRHYDHVDGVADLNAKYQVPVFAHPNTNLKVLLGLSNIIDVTDKQTLSFWDNQLNFQVLYAPGHTNCHVMYYIPDVALFCGDVLFSAGCGRVNTVESTMETMNDTLQIFLRLPINIMIYPAHEYTVKNLEFARLVSPNNEAVLNALKWAIEQRNKGLPTLPTKLLQQLQINPFLRLTAKDIIEFVVADEVDPVDSVAVFQYLRAQRNNF